MKGDSMRFIPRILALTLLSFSLINMSAPCFAERIDPGSGAADPDGKTVWYDCTLLIIEGKGWTNTESFYDRLPAKAKDTAPASVWGLSHDSAGICVRFTTDAPSLQVRWTLLKNDLAMPHMPATGVSGVDLYFNDPSGKWRFVANGRPSQITNTALFSLTPGSEFILYLPLYNGVKSVEIGIPVGKAISTPAQSPRERRKPIMFYGTSITQGGCASRPGMAATAIVGRALDIPVINLGFSGSGRMEPEMGDLIMELDPSVFVLDCLWNMTPDIVAERLEPFVRKLRAAHPDTPILLAEDSSFRNITPTEKGRLARDIYRKLTKEGIKHLYFLPNKGMLGTDFDGTVDTVHPNDLGMQRQAEVFIKALAPILRTGK
jgi:hypothetical protein